MAENKSIEKSPWEYALVAISTTATIVELINVFTPGSQLFANQFVTAAFVIALLIVIISICLTVILRRKSPKRFFYSDSRRWWAQIVLGISATGIILLVVFGYVYRPCLIMVDRFPASRFGILVADLTEGASRAPTQRGQDIALSIFDQLKDIFYFSNLESKVDTNQVCVIRNEEEAIRAAKSSGASLVVWGTVTDKSIHPNFTIIEAYNWTPNSAIREIISPVFGEKVSVDNLDTLSYRIETFLNFVLGFVYLDTASGPDDYDLAIREFSSGIDTILEEMKSNNCSGIEDQAVKRALAIMYTGRGRGLETSDHLNDAAINYQSALDCDGQYSAPYIGMGNILYRKQDFSAARTYYHKALDVWESASAFYGLGNTSYYLGSYNDSIFYYKKAIELTELDGYNAADIRILLGETYLELESYELAFDQFSVVASSAIATEQQRTRARELLSMAKESLTATPTTVTSASSTLRPTLRATTTHEPSHSNIPTRTPEVPTNLPLTNAPTTKPPSTPTNVPTTEPPPAPTQRSVGTKHP